MMDKWVTRFSRYGYPVVFWFCLLFTFEKGGNFYDWILKITLKRTLH